MVFAKRAAKEMTAEFDKTKTKSFDNVDFTPYEDKKKLEEEYKQLIRDEIDKENAKNEEKQENYFKCLKIERLQKDREII